MEIKPILEKTFNQMLDNFSSITFFKYARKNGLPEYYAQNSGGVINYLHGVAKKTGPRKWVKRDSINFNQEPLNSEFQIQQAIQLLKSKGYRVFKTKTELVEL
jgi:hypothetical protein